MPTPTAADRLWRNPAYRRLWFSILLSAIAGQVTTLALALAAAVELQASAAQIGLLGAMGTLPFVLFLLPAGVWLDRRRKLPVYVAGELASAAALACVPLAWAAGRLGMELLYAVAFAGGCVSALAGTAGQVVLTQVVGRDQLVEAHGRNRIAGAFAEIAGPGLAGLLVKAVGAPLALLANGALLLSSAALLRGIDPGEAPAATGGAGFLARLAEGLRFVAGDRLLLSMALAVGAWQVFQTCAMVTQVLFATRELGLDATGFGLCLTGAGLGTVAAGAHGHRLARRIGPGPALIAGMAVSGAGWLQLAWAPSVAAYVLMLFCFGTGVVLIFSNMLALRQALTPAPMLARMTGTMRWLTLFPAWPGMLLGGALGENFGLRLPLAVGGIGALLLALGLWRFSGIRRATALAATAP